MMKLVYLVLGILSTALGAVGVVLPILPTTPFLLVAAFCFAKSSGACTTGLLVRSCMKSTSRRLPKRGP